ncbi:MAG: PEP-CTERM sorting domain-containing protein [Betaproteobacteria bacterium]
MKLSHVAALALLAMAPALASASAFTVDFEHPWNYASDVNGYYAGGTADDGTSGVNLGVSFVNVSGLSNDADFTYYSGAPSPLGTAYAHDAAFINVGAGVYGNLSFFYSTPVAVTGAIKAYSGLNGTGTLLGTFDLGANSSESYDTWSSVTLRFDGVAQSFDLSGSDYAVGFDNISTVPEAASTVMMLAGVGLLAGLARRRRV